MSQRTVRSKAKRRASKLSTKSWEALEEGDSLMALKLARRATIEHPGNATFWSDLGLIAQQNDSLEEAERAFQSAILLDPNRAEGYANFAALCAQRGRLHQAARLQERAAQLAPTIQSFQEKATLYLALITTGSGSLKTDEQSAASSGVSPDSDAHRSFVRNSLATEKEEQKSDIVAQTPASLSYEYNWEGLDGRLQRDGYALLPKLWSSETCREIVEMYEREERFEKTILLEDGQGNGEYKFFRRPLPSAIEEARSALYEKLAPIANAWNELLRSEARFPKTHQEFLEVCHQNDQHRTTPILLRYKDGGYNELHQDIWGRVFFPFQVAITLSKRDQHFTGGAFLLAEEGHGKRATRASIETDLGDAVIFCARHRLVKVGRVYALTQMKHGLSTVAGERFCVGIPFHEYL